MWSDPPPVTQFESKPCISAIATPVGEGALSIVRLSGRDAVAIADRLFKGARPLSEVPAGTIHYGHVVDPATGAMVDEVMASVFRAPRSFTGEDSVELTGHGGVLVTQQVFEATLAAGARAAGPGEFTQRAFLNGKIDLSQAEAVADLIHAQSAGAAQAARVQLEGRLGEEVSAFRQALIDATAMVELELDFSEEDVEFADRSQLRALLGGLSDRVEELTASYEAGRLIRDGVRTAIVGRPNAGKSTLLNALVGRERAIVTPQAGTTRDTIEVDWSHGGLRFVLIDTAGIRETEDVIEAEGVRRSTQALRTADLALYLKDATTPLETAEREAIDAYRAMLPPGVALLTVLTQVDRLAGEGSGEDSDEENGWQDAALPDGAAWDARISALTGAGMEALRRRMLEEVLTRPMPGPGSVVVTSSRHRDALMRTGEHVRSAIAGLDAGLPGDLLAIDLRGALHQLGLITGAITHEDVLDSIFSRFCIGK